MTASTSSFADDPFGPQLPPGALFIGSTLQQRIDLIEHLLEFGRQIIVLSGPAGSGKSTLLTAIAQAAGQRWTCVPVQGGPALQARPMLAQIADALDVDLSADSEPRMAQTMLKLRLNVLERAGKLTVILVDDADQLPPDAVASLVALARSDDQAAEARVLLAADQDHAGLLANLQRDRPQHGLVHVIEIPPLAEAHTADFIAQRLTAVGLTLGERFSHGDIQRIAAAAAGNPARVVALARQHFASHQATRRDAGGVRGGERRPAGARTWQVPSLDKRWRLGGLALLPLLALGVWWGLRDDGETTPSEASVQLALPPQPTASSVTEAGPKTPARPAEPPARPTPEAPAKVVEDAPAPDPRLADNGDRELIEIVLPDEPVLTPSAAPAEPANPVPPSAAPAQPSVSATATPVPPPAAQATATEPLSPRVTAVPPPKPPPPSPSPSPAPSRATAAAKPATAPAPARAAPAPRTPAPEPKAAPPRRVAEATPRVAGFSAEWLLKQPRGAYTLQLAGVRDRASAARFIQRHGLAAETTILNTRRNGQPWYVLVHGYYPTRQAAVAAAARLPAAVKKEVQPWARTVGELASLPR